MNVRLLLVEPDPDWRLRLTELLRRELPGAEIEVVDDRAGFDRALAGGGLDAIVTEHELPWGSGLDLLAQVRGHFAGLPVVMVTGGGSESLAVRGLKSGLDEYLTKSDEDLARLPAVMRTILAVVRRGQGVHYLEEAHLREAQKMEAVGRLAGGVAQDFNALLTTVLGYCELMLDRLSYSQGDPLHWQAVEIKKAALQGVSLTQRLLAFSRRQVLQPRALDLNELLGGMSRMLERLLGDQIALSMRLAPQLAPVRSDPAQLEQVIVNLALNARAAMPEGGTLIVETSDVELDRGFAQRYMGVNPGAYGMLAFSDSGLGIDKETRERIFEPFFTTRGSGQGAGMGLAAAYGIIKQSGGHISVYSEPGKGSTFRVYLPRGVPVPDRTPAPIVTARGAETVLLADDEPMIRQLASALLENAGYTVLEAGSGEVALQIGEQYRGPIHLLLTDVVMPGLTGPELADRLASLRPDLKVFYMSGYTDEAIVHHGLIKSGVAFMQKPFMAESLLAKVRELLDQP